MPAKRRTLRKYRKNRPLWQFIFLTLLLIGLVYALICLLISAKRGPFSGGAVPTTAIIATYKGTIPCANCTGIDDTLILDRDNTYIETYVYLGKNTSLITKGTWNIRKGTPKDPSSWVYELTPWQSTTTFYYLVKKSQLIPLDSSYGEIPAPYNAPLTKQ